MTNELITEEETQRARLTYLTKFMGLSEEEGRNLITVLTQETPKNWILERPIRGGGTAKYVPGYRFIERFNDAFGFLWSQEFPWFEQTDKEIISKGRWSLQIPGRTVTRKYEDGNGRLVEETARFDGFSIVKEQFGSAEIKKWATNRTDKQGKIIAKAGDSMDVGNDYKAASTDAMKKCGTELGMFLDVYGARETAESSGPSETQLSSFYFRADKAGMDEEKADTWAEEQLGKPLKEADQQMVLGLVADLIDLAKEQK